MPIDNIIRNSLTALNHLFSPLNRTCRIQNHLIGSYKMTALWAHGSAVVGAVDGWTLTVNEKGTSITAKAAGEGIVYLPVSSVGGKTFTTLYVTLIAGTSATLTQADLYNGQDQIDTNINLKVTGADVHAEEYSISNAPPMSAGLAVALELKFNSQTSPRRLPNLELRYPGPALRFPQLFARTTPHHCGLS
jgi:hypothetical protein